MVVPWIRYKLLKLKKESNSAGGSTNANKSSENSEEEIKDPNAVAMESKEGEINSEITSQVEEEIKKLEEKIEEELKRELEKEEK